MEGYIPHGLGNLVCYTKQFCSTLREVGPLFCLAEADFSHLLEGSEDLANKINTAKLANAEQKIALAGRNQHLKSAFISIIAAINNLKNTQAWKDDYDSLDIAALPANEHVAKIIKKVSKGHACEDDYCQMKGWLTNAIGTIKQFSYPADLPGTGIIELKLVIENALGIVADYDQARICRQNIAADRDACAQRLIKSIKEIVTHLKLSPLWNDDYAVALKVHTVPVRRITTNFKPIAWLRDRGDNIRVNFIRDGVNGMNIYSRIAGETDFVLLAYSERSPFRDPRPIVPGVTEIREYFLVGVVAGKEVGEPGEIISIRIARKKHRRYRAQQLSMNL